MRPFRAVDPPAPWQALAVEFPAIELRDRRGEEPIEGPSLPLLHHDDWASSSFDFYELDALLDELAERTRGPLAVRLTAAEERLEGFARQVLTRCQRLMDQRNAASRGALFDRVLEAHRAMHDLSKPLVRADYNHALDVWQWTLRLFSEAGLALQLAALFHDVERLVSEADVRVEHQAADYPSFKDAHARRGAELAEEALARAGIEAETRRRAGRLIAAHERPAAGGDPEAADLAVLNDADALSFFSLNSPGYLDYYGPEQTRSKVAYTLRRLRPQAHPYLAGMRLLPPVAEMVAAELAGAVRERVA